MKYSESKKTKNKLRLKTNEKPISIILYGCIGVSNIIRNSKTRKLGKYLRACGGQSDAIKISSLLSCGAITTREEKLEKFISRIKLIALFLDIPIAIAFCFDYVSFATSKTSREKEERNKIPEEVWRSISHR